ncbi:hypothetical protein BV25DRAFT_1831197 [Artomyces pyxidatus]|uniref:Uncharacterized protein n=1 Tax=Artomyces pyxidatus TaxID=48021 RepID=A0ACB8SMA0_9AGAM|nr:hypothetical protein BV25DRAFT_1831197 [Artomyces pyxidatus]
MEDLVTKRLHVSGLTPAISFDDISRRLGSFGSVTSLDGFGKLDGLGQPRKYAYVTLHTTKAKLAKCMNVLSGSTWKGAKLRIGEAKPDFRERIAQEHDAAEEPPRKRARLARGVKGRHAQDMALVTPDNLHLHPQWHVTPLGRLIRPLRMRPERPLGPPLEVQKAKVRVKVGKDGKSIKGKERKRKREPPTRSRRRTIDPLRWGSTHLKGVFLENVAVVPRGDALDEREGHVSDAEDESEEGEDDDDDDEQEEQNIAEALQKDVDTPPSPLPASPLPPAPASATHRVSSRLVSSLLADAVDIAAEKARQLALLQSMFGDDGDDWGGVESAGSDVDMDDLSARADIGRGDDDMEIEVVPKAKPTGELPLAEEESDDTEADLDTTTAEETVEAPRPPPRTQVTKLKDLFAPREEDAGFSLLGHLDLDLELDEPDEPLPLPTAPPAPTASAAPARAGLDASLPLFFPKAARGTWRGTFVRTADEGEIRARWEAARGELTREWKRRHREAVKSRRRRGGEAEP